jgi:hypothetical protein
VRHQLRLLPARSWGCGRPGRRSVCGLWRGARPPDRARGMAGLKGAGGPWELRSGGYQVVGCEAVGSPMRISVVLSPRFHHLLAIRVT